MECELRLSHFIAAFGVLFLVIAHFHPLPAPLMYAAGVMVLMGLVEPWGLALTLPVALVSPSVFIMPICAARGEWEWLCSIDE